MPVMEWGRKRERKHKKVPGTAWRVQRGGCFFLDRQPVVRLNYPMVSGRGEICCVSMMFSAFDYAQGSQSRHFEGQTGPMNHINNPGYVLVGLWHLLFESPFASGLDKDTFIL